MKKIKRLVVIVCILIMCAGNMALPALANETGIGLISEDTVAIDTSGTVSMTIADEGDFHPLLRDSVEMIIAIVILIAVVCFIFWITDRITSQGAKANNIESAGKKKDNSDKDEESQKTPLQSAIGLLGYVLVMIIMILFFRNVVTMAKIPSASMETTLMVGDRCIINSLSYMGSATPKRGDIVIFQNEEYGKEILIKRVIGMPGDHVSFYDGALYINGGLVYEEYLDPGVVTYSDYYYDVPEGRYFVLGDNREVSADARFWKNPFLTESQIMGRHILTIHTGKKN